MPTVEHAMTREMQQCAEECLACYSSCEHTAQHCLEIGGKHAEVSHIRILRDCAEICRTSAGFLLRGSDLHTQTCALCAEICRICERECRRLGDDEVMRECAEACRRCAESCERMAAVRS